MNKRGQVGAFVTLAITAIVVLVLIPTIAQYVGQTTETGTITYQVTPAAASASIDLTGQEYMSTATVVNESDAFDCSGNVSIAEGVSPRTGTKRIIMTSDATISSIYCSTLNVSYDYAPEGYIDDAGGRGLAGLIVIMAALALAVVVVGQATGKEFWTDMLNK